MPDATLPNRIKDGIVSILQALPQMSNLAGGIVPQMMPDPQNMTFPCIVVTEEGETEDLGAGTTQATQAEYPYRVFLMDTDMDRRHDRAPQFRIWRKAAMDALHQRPRVGGESIPSVPEVAGTRVIPKVIFDPKQAEYGAVVSGFVVRALAFEGL